MLTFIAIWAIVITIVVLHVYPLLFVLILRSGEYFHCFQAKLSVKVLVGIVLLLLTDAALRHLNLSPIPHLSIPNGNHKMKWFEMVASMLILQLLKRIVDPKYPSGEMIAKQCCADKVIVVTGGNSGIGFESAKSFARMGATVIIGCRNAERGNTAADKINAASRSKRCINIPLDLSSFESVVTFWKTVRDQFGKVDVLVNNAGLAPVRHVITDDGLESSIQVMHFSHHLLTRLMLPIMTKQARIVNVSSLGHHMGTAEMLSEEEVKGARKVCDGGMALYGRAKLANVLFTHELQRFLDSNQETVGMSTYTLHPGCVYTNIWEWPIPFRRVLAPYLSWWFRMYSFMLMRTSPEGSADIVYAAVDPDAVQHKCAFFMCLSPASINPIAANTENQSNLWKLSEKLTCDVRESNR